MGVALARVSSSFELSWLPKSDPAGLELGKSLPPHEIAISGGARMVPKRVVHGELVYFLRKETPNQLTLGVEISAAGRFAFTARSRKGLRRSGHLHVALCFEREPPGSERDLQGSFRSPESRAKTLEVSD